MSVYKLRSPAPLPARLVGVLRGRFWTATLGPVPGRRVGRHGDLRPEPGLRPGRPQPAPTWLVPGRPWNPSPPSGGCRPHIGPAESRSFRTPGPPRHGACSVRAAWKVFWNTGFWSLEPRGREPRSALAPHPKSPAILFP